MPIQVSDNSCHQFFDVTFFQAFLKFLSGFFTLLSFAASRLEMCRFYDLSHSAPRLLSPNKAHATPALSVPASFNQFHSDSLTRFENIVPPWSAGRSQRPLSAKSSGSKPSPAPANRDSSSNADVEFAHMRSVAADALCIPLWKFEQQGVSAITDTAFRMNHGKVLKSPRSQHMASYQASGVMPLPVQSSNTQGACLRTLLLLPLGPHALGFRRKFDWTSYPRSRHRHP